MNATCVLENKNSSCCWSVPTVGYPLYPKASVGFGSRKESNFPEWLQSYSRHGETVLVNARINIGIGYDTVGDSCSQQCCIQNCRPTAADRNVVISDSLCKVAVVLSNITIADPLYDVQFSHRTCVTDRQTTDTRHIVLQKQGQWNYVNFHKTWEIIN